MVLLTLPQEILSHILAFLDAEAICRFGSTSKEARELISPQNQLLWKATFLQVFDDPNDSSASMPAGNQPLVEFEWDWHRELKRRFEALFVVRSRTLAGDDRDRVDDYLSTLLSIVDTAKFAPSPYDITRGKSPAVDDRTLSRNLQVLTDLDHFHRPGLESLIHDSAKHQANTYPGSDENPWNSPLRPFTRSMAHSAFESHRPESASRLHVLTGITIRERIEHKARGAARRKVYNWHLTGPDNDHGPLKRDGSGKVDWSLLEGICSIIGRNFELCVDGHLNMPQNICYSIPHRTLVDPAVPNDWAGIGGSWLGTYSFLDYADLFAFNSTDFHIAERPSLDHEQEACGDLMKLDLRLDASISTDKRLHTDLPTSTSLPQLFFSGFSRASAGPHRPTIGIRGTVILVPGDREVRWRFIIQYGGQDQWQLEGIQPGGVRAGGIFGLWSHCDHEENGPVGPFCYFPAELCKPTSIVLVQ